MKNSFFFCSCSVLRWITAAAEGSERRYSNKFGLLTAGSNTYILTVMSSTSTSLKFLRFASHLSTVSAKELACTVEDTCVDNLFEEYVQRKFSLSSFDIAKIIKVVPRLEKIESIRHIENFVDFCKKCGCSEADIGTIILRNPVLLRAKTMKLLEQKVQLLKDFGLVGENLVKVLTFRPRILSTSLERVLFPRIGFLQKVFQTKDLLVRALVRAPSLLLYDLEKKLKPSVESLESFGLKDKELAALLLTRPSLLVRSSLTPDKISYIHKLGIAKESKMYKHALAVVAASKMETLDEKFQNLVDLGLSSNEVSAIFRVSPYIFILSKEKVRRHMEFIVNSMGLPANAVVKAPYLLSLNLESRIKPRFLVFEKLQSMGLEKKLKSYRGFLSMPEKKFLERFVNVHRESSVLFAVYTSALQDVSNVVKVSSKAFTY
eukprot:Gb_15878 [translate_table: standard]